MTSLWRIKITEDFIKSLKKISNPEQTRIALFLKKLDASSDPLIFGKRLTGHLNHFWSFRVGNYRLIADVRKHILTIVFLHSGHRKDIYNNL